MSKLFVYSRNALFTWGGYGANLVVLLLLSPFVVRCLGDRAYGVWTMLMGMTGYLGLAELGVRVSTGRFINFHLGRHDSESFNRVIVSSLAFYGVISAVVLAATALLGWAGPGLLERASPWLAQWLSPHMLQAAHDMAQPARWVLPLLGLNVALGFFAATFGQILCASDRFDLLTWADLGALVVRAAGTVLVLWAGGGFVALAVVNVATAAVGLVGRLAAARRWGPAFVLSARYLCRRTLGEVMRFGGWSFISNTANLLIHYTDTILIGLLLGPECVTAYAIGLLLVEHGRRLLFDGVGVISPDIMKAAGRQDNPALHRLMISGTRAAVALALPMLAAFLIFGQEFITLWMGPGRQESGRILAILTLSLFGGTASRPAIAVLSGIGCVRFLAAECIAEGLLNLGLSVVLVCALHWGIDGVAIGTLVPMLIFNNLLVPAFACRRMGLGVASYFAATAGRWIPVALATVALAALIRAALPGGGWLSFATKVAILLAAYAPLAVGVVLGPHERARVFQTVGQLLRLRGGIAIEKEA